MLDVGHVGQQQWSQDLQPKGRQCRPAGGGEKTTLTTSPLVLCSSWKEGNDVRLLLDRSMLFVPRLDLKLLQFRSRI